MYQRNEVTDKTTVGRIEFGPEQRAEIDYRVAQKLAEREYFNRQYTRGIWDCLYALFIIGCIAVIFYNYWTMEK